MQYCIDCKNCLPYSEASKPELVTSLARCSKVSLYPVNYVTPTAYDVKYQFCELARGSETCDNFEAKE